MKDTDTDVFIKIFRSSFDHSINTLDAKTLSRIALVRNNALGQTPVTKSGFGLWLPAGAFVTACMAMLIFGLLPQTTVEDDAFIDEIEIISELELYENLEFYDWLEQQEIPS